MPNATKTITVTAADASGKLSNRAYHAAGTAQNWWLRDDTTGQFVDIGVHRGDRDFEVQVEVVVGHCYTLGAGRGRDAVRGEFVVEADRFYIESRIGAGPWQVEGSGDDFASEAEAEAAIAALESVNDDGDTPEYRVALA